jgi:hypothetical protein
VAGQPRSTLEIFFGGHSVMVADYEVLGLQVTVATVL